MRRTLGVALALLCLCSACSSGSAEEGRGPSGLSASHPAAVIAAEVASYDLAVGGQRFIVGLFTQRNLTIAFGRAHLAFSYLGTRSDPQKPAPAFNADADFIPVAGSSGQSEGPAAPRAVPASRGRGVYGAEVKFDRAGFWQVRVTVDIAKLGRQSAAAKFEVLEHHEVPAPGDKALRTKNLTMSSNAPLRAIDSRAEGGARVPDPELHRTTIARSIGLHQPALVVFSTPVFCISRFCGPITNMVDKLSKRYKDRANFIHVEIWRDYRHHVLNKAAADWLYHHNDLREPWVFLIGSNGRIVARWDNVVDMAEVIPYLKALPRLR